jgi:cytochrome-b5 reductase
MPNHHQLVFLASFCISFLFLLLLSNFLSSKLREAGYDISRLILIGISQSENIHPRTPNKMSTPAPFLDQHQSVVTQLFALLLAVATSAFIYLKFGRSGTSSFSFYSLATTHTLAMI